MLRFMLVDATFVDASVSSSSAPPTISLFGTTINGHSICCIIQDFIPYFWFPAPVHIQDMEEDLLKEKLEALKNYLNHHHVPGPKRSKIVSNSSVARVALAFRNPLLYYRLGGPFPFLKVEVWRSRDTVSVGKRLSLLARENSLRDDGMTWNESVPYEENIKLGMRFFCETGIAGGAWLEIQQSKVVPLSERRTRCETEVYANWQDLHGLTPDLVDNFTSPQMSLGSQAVMEDDHDAASEISDDAFFDTNIGLDNDVGSKFQTSVEETSNTRNMDAKLEESKWSMLPPLKILALNVLCIKNGTADRHSGKKQAAEKCNFVNDVDDVNVMHFNDIEDSSECLIGNSVNSSTDSVLIISNIISLPNDKKQLQIVFTYGMDMNSQHLPGIDVRVHTSEATMLKAWEKFVHSEIDPDVICFYQLKDSLRYIVDRLKYLKLGGLEIGRDVGQLTQVKSVVTYRKDWVRKQARMSATSNQEVYRAAVGGRVIIDMLRIVLVAYNLLLFTLGECSQAFLKKPKEVLSAATIGEIWNQKGHGQRRLISYSLKEAEVSLELMERLQTLPETIEMARVTGLSIMDVIYKAQMVRIQSLLLRCAGKEGWLLGGPSIEGQLSESPYLKHPLESETAGYYEDPIAILDFASLYPSVYMSHNLCYTTLIHPDDAKILKPGSIIASPTGAQFVTPEVRHGVLPRICGALIAARKRAKEQICFADTNQQAVLDGRQKALKLCSNALYGFTGACASPQQCVPLADSCLSIGAAACKMAAGLVEEKFQCAKVIYAQTDSLFVMFKNKDIREAMDLAVVAAESASSAFPSPMALKFERVLCPFLLLQVNRYAGKQFTDTKDISQGMLYVRGIESERRDVPVFVRQVCKDVLHQILIYKNVKSALHSSREAIRKLMSGEYSMYDLLLTGGLWRVDDNDISRLAGANKKPGNVVGTLTAEEGRGPHVALAVRLKRRDPNRQFHLGERIPYVLLARHVKLQDDMAEDPLIALMENLQINAHVYLENKLRKPLEAILEHVADKNDLRELFCGKHVTLASTVCSSTGDSQALVSSFYKAKPTCMSCRKQIDDNVGPLCRLCYQDKRAIDMATMFLSQKKHEESRFWGAHAECLRCQSGHSYGTVLCTNLACPLLYVRYESPRRISNAQDMLQKLDNVN